MNAVLVLRQIMDDNAENHQGLMFLIEVGKSDFDEMLAYSKHCDLIEMQRQEELEDPSVIYRVSLQSNHRPSIPDSPQPS